MQNASDDLLAGLIAGGTTLSENMSGDTYIILVNDYSMAFTGDSIHIELDAGGDFDTIIEFADDDTILLEEPLPSAAASGNVVWFGDVEECLLV